MTAYVDALMHSGWHESGRNGRPAQSFHMFSDTEDHDELHAIALVIGQKRAWFLNGGRTPYYHLTPGKPAQAITDGAVPVGRSLAVRIWRVQTSRGREERRA